MADGTDLELSVGAVADKASAEKTGKDLSKVILSNIGKDGHVEIPVEFKAPIKGASKELEKAQKDVIEQWEKTFKEGFSSSAKDLNDLTSAYQKFKRLAGKEHKGNTKQSRGLTNIMGEPIQEYTTKRNTRRAEYNKALNKTKTNEIEQPKTTRTKQKRDSYEGLDSITKSMNYKTKSGVDPSRTNNHEFKLSEISPYGSNMASDQVKAMEEMAERVRASLQVRVDKDEANKIYAPDSRKTSEYIVSKDEAKDAFKQIATVLGQLENGRKDVTTETLTNQVAEAVDKGLKSGLDLEAVYNKIAEKLQGRYSDNPMRRLGSTDGSEKGVGKNHDEAVTAQQEILKTLNKVWDSLPSYITMAKRFYQDSNKVITNSSVINGSKQVVEAMNKAFKPLNDIYNSSEKSIRYDKIENDRAGVADNAEAKTNKDILAVSKDTSSTVEDDATTGFNADSKANELIKNMAGKGKTTIDKTEKEIPADTISFNEQIEDALKQIIAILEVIKDTLSSGLTVNTTTRKRQTKKKQTKKEDESTEREQAPYIPNLVDMIEESNSANKRLQEAFQNGFAKDLPNPNLLPTIRFEDTFKPIATLLTKTSKKMSGQPVETPEVINNKNGLPQLALPEHGTPDNYLSEEDIQKAIDHVKLPEIKGDDFLDKLKNILNKVFSGSEANYYSKLNKQQQDEYNAKRVTTYGLNNSSISGTNTGDFAGMERRRNFWRNRDNTRSTDMFKDVNLGEGVHDIDVDKIMSKFTKALQGGMFKAQTGGVMRNLVGAATGYIGMPSLEKTRAEADGLNQVMGNVRNTLLSTIEDINTKESTLRGLQASGNANIDDQGNFISGSEEAKAVYAEYEELKLVLKSILADTANMDKIIGQTGGKISEIIKQLNFSSQPLQKNNVILKNLNAGLNKNGQALKYQTRTAETLNYTFQLMARSLGQTLKSILSMLNPFNLIKKAFSDFTSYDTKWQRTMNVIKYNLRRIIKPMMEWIAQQIVNIIGLVNALMKGIGKVFGQNWDLFDQAAAATEQMEENLEASANASAGFDELHDISSESGMSSAADDLTGDIYTPQWDSLYEKIENIGEKIGTVFQNIKDKIGEIIDSFKNGDFWKWLIIAGAALLGFVILKTLIEWFTGKNPLSSIASGIKSLLKAVGTAILIEAFADFVEVLTDFMEVMIKAEWDDVWQALVTLGLAFLFLVGAVAGVQKLTKIIGLDWTSLLGLAAVVEVFNLFVEALVPFIEAISDLGGGTDTWEVIGESLFTLAAAFIELIAGVAGMEELTKLIGLDWKSMLGIAGIVVAFDLFVAALVPLIETIGSIEDYGLDDIGNLILTLAGAFVILVGALALVSKCFTGMEWSAVGEIAALILVFDTFVLALAVLVKALDGSGDDIKLILEGIGSVVESICTGIATALTVVKDLVVEIIAVIAVAIIGLAVVIADIVENIIILIDHVIDKIRRYCNRNCSRNWRNNSYYN